MRAFRLRPLKELTDIIFPRHCVCCGQMLLGDERHLCTSCLMHLPYTCNAAVAGNDTEQHFQAYHDMVAAMSLLYFSHHEDTRRIVHRIKYGGDRRLAVAMGRLMGETLVHSRRFADIDVLIPVPLHRRREQQRGYNQSEMLCRGIALQTGRPVSTGNLVRTVNTASQTHMNIDERAANVHGVFTVRQPAKLAGLHILLVDDVITTGSTTSACCDALYEAGNVTVSVASLALTAT